MFVEEIKAFRKGKTYRSVLIRETFRIGKIIHHRTLANISKLPDEHIDRIKRALGKFGSKVKTVDFSKFQILASKEFGASFTVLKTLRNLGLDAMIYSRRTEWRENALAMICGRIVFQGSKLSLVNRYLDTKLWELADGTITARAAAASVSAAAGGSTGAGVSGAGAVSTNAINTRVNAYIDDSTITSAVDVAASLSAEHIENLGDLLKGRATGVVVTQGSGVAGSTREIRIRGRSSMQDRSDAPLLVVADHMVVESPLPDAAPRLSS